MGYVTLNQAREKMVIAEDILNAGGLVLVGKRTVLTTAIIDRLKGHKIPGLTVHDPQPAGEPSCSTASPENEQDLERRFSLVRGDPIMEELLGAVMGYFSEKDAGNDN